jgi:hypothetical protein
VTLVGVQILFVKCHGEPENHKLLYDYGATTLSLWEIQIDIISLRKKKWEGLVHSS